MLHTRVAGVVLGSFKQPQADFWEVLLFTRFLYFFAFLPVISSAFDIHFRLFHPTTITYQYYHPPEQSC